MQGLWQNQKKKKISEEEGACNEVQCRKCRLAIDFWIDTYVQTNVRHRKTLGGGGPAKRATAAKSESAAQIEKARHLTS
jgi:hypothetical protein